MAIAIKGGDKMEMEVTTYIIISHAEFFEWVNQKQKKHHKKQINGKIEGVHIDNEKITFEIGRK